jgi:hypothetical protein
MQLNVERSGNMKDMARNLRCFPDAYRVAW